MKLIIAGGRELKVTAGFIAELIAMINIQPTEVISGGARGIDRCAEVFVEQWNQMYKTPQAISSNYVSKEIKLTIMEADWQEHGKAAGPIRNEQMAQAGDALLLIWDGESKGSSNMKQNMVKLNKPVYEFILKGVKGVPQAL